MKKEYNKFYISMDYFSNLCSFFRNQPKIIAPRWWMCWSSSSLVPDFHTNPCRPSWRSSRTSSPCRRCSSWSSFWWTSVRPRRMETETLDPVLPSASSVAESRPRSWSQWLRGQCYSGLLICFQPPISSISFELLDLSHSGYRPCR